MARAYIFPGQGSQFVGMAHELYSRTSKAKEMFELANDFLGFSITELMFKGPDSKLQETQITQPAVFLNSVVQILSREEPMDAVAVAGHSLGEFSALVAGGILSFEDGLNLVNRRAKAMQMACEKEPAAMAAVIGLDDNIVEAVCHESNELVVAANYNCPGQLVISGTLNGIRQATEQLEKRGARSVVPLPVGGAFHSPLMEEARLELSEAIDATDFKVPELPIYQNVDGKPHTEVNDIRLNLKKQLTSPVRWTQTIQNMIQNDISFFTVAAPGKTMRGILKRVKRSVKVTLEV